MAMKPKVLFLCTGNSCRSQMAEAFLRTMAGDRFEVQSAGTDPVPVNPNAIRVMAERGIDISHHRSKGVKQFLGQGFPYLITVCDSANERCPIFPGVINRLHWSFEDPAGAKGSDEERLHVFRRVRDEIEAAVRRFVQEVEEGHPITGAIHRVRAPAAV
jgi:arsenate reductase